MTSGREPNTTNPWRATLTPKELAEIRERTEQICLERAGKPMSDRAKQDLERLEAAEGSSRARPLRRPSDAAIEDLRRELHDRLMKAPTDRTAISEALTTYRPTWLKDSRQEASNPEQEKTELARAIREAMEATKH